MTAPESQVLKACLDYLRIKRHLVYRINSGAIKMEYNPLYDGKVIRTEKVDGVTHYYYSKTDKKMVIDTGRTMFTVSDKIVSPEKIPRWISSHKLLGWLHYRIFRGWFLRWLLEY